jgi:hypothetical protein
MRLKIFTFSFLLLLANTAFAQWIVDSVSMGSASANDQFYRMDNLGAVKSENNRNWHIAFSMSPSDSGSVWANHNTGNSFVKVYNIHKTYAQWASVTLADTATANLCYNYDKGWHQGAFNDLPRPSVFGFGWGTYNMTSHNVIGDSMFIVKADTSFYKVYIHSLISVPMDWDIEVENFATGISYRDTISRGTVYANKNFAYYNLATGTELDREPAKTTWDFVFNRYNTLASIGGPFIPYSVIGVLSNKGVNVVKVNPVHVDSAFAHYDNYVYPWPSNSKMISGIGYDWKVPPAGPPPATWSIPDSMSYFVQNSASPIIYQLQFLGYSGSGSGNILFRKRSFDPTSITDVNSAISSYNFYPNPATQTIHCMLQSKEHSSATWTISDMTGKIVLHTPIALQLGINGYQLSIAHLQSGNYIISIHGNKINVSEKLVVSK